MNDTRSQSAGNEDDLKWLAGFMDGEGSYLVASPTNWRPAYKPMVTVNNTHKPSIERISSILKSNGIGHWVSRTDHIGRNHKPNFTVEISGMKRVIKLLPLLLPYAFTKKEQIETLLAFLKLRMGGSIRTSYGDAELGLITKLRGLNRFGSSETLSSPQVNVYTREDIVHAS